MTLARSVTAERRKRRVGSDEAHAWARNLRLGNPYAKLVLSMMTIYVNADGTAFVGVEQLADDCELAADTVRKRLVWLEKIGAITRLPQWLDENGRRNSDGRGRRTSDEIRLMIDSDPDEIEARASGDDEPAAPHDEISPLPGRGLNQVEATPPNLALPSISPLVAPQLERGPYRLTTNPNPEDSPPTPPGGSDPSPSAGEDWPGSESWASFERAFEEPILRQSIARQVWSALTPEERDLATRAARGYVAWRRSQKKPPNVIGAQTFLRERDAWVKYAALAPVAPPEKRDYPAGSPEYRASSVFAVLLGRPPITGASMTAPASIAPDVIALGQFTADRETWVQLDPHADRQEIAAWRERIKEWTGRWIELEKVPVLGPDGDPLYAVQQWDGQELKFPKKREVLIVPCRWPPRKDGALAKEEAE